jgi:hypothetical protein
MKINTIQFETLRGVKRREIPLIRREIASQFLKDVRFHNHANGKYAYTYPKVLYQSIKGFLQLKFLGFDRIPEFTSELLGEKRVLFKYIKDEIYKPKISKGLDYEYRFVSPWYGLSTKNYKKFKSGELQKEDYEAILTGNILSFLKGNGFWVDERIQVELEGLECGRIKMKGRSAVGFYGVWKSNIDLPKHIGLGRCVSRGFGMIEKVRSC